MTNMHTTNLRLQPLLTPPSALHRKPEWCHRIRFRAPSLHAWHWLCLLLCWNGHGTLCTTFSLTVSTAAWHMLDVKFLSFFWRSSQNAVLGVLLDCVTFTNTNTQNLIMAACWMSTRTRTLVQLTTLVLLKNSAGFLRVLTELVH